MSNRRYRWSDVAVALKQLTPVAGGFSSARRGLIVLPDGRQAFVKAGVDESTRRWAQKEIAVYRFLDKHSYPHLPRLLACNDDETSFALEALLPGDGWDWSESWNDQRLDRTLDRLTATLERRLERHRHELSGLAGRLDALSPLKILERGYALARDEQGRVLKRVVQFPSGLRFRLRVTDGDVAARAGES